MGSLVNVYMLLHRHVDDRSYSGWLNSSFMEKHDFGEIGYGGPAPPDGRHTYIFKAYALDTNYFGSERRLFQTGIRGCNERSYFAEAKLTGTFAP